MKKISIKIISVIVIIIILSTISYGANSSTLKNQQQQVNKQINEKKSELEDVKEEKNETIAQVDALTDKISEVQEAIDELNQKVDTLNGSIKENEEKLSQAKEDYSKQQELLNQRLVSMYEAGDTTYLDVLLSAKDFTDLISNWFLVSELATYDTDMLNKIEEKKNEIEETQTKLETDKKELQTAKSSKEAKNVELKEAKAEKNKKVAELSSEEKAIQEELQELQEYNQQISNEIKEAERKYAAQIAALNKNNSNNSNNNGGSSSAYTGTGTFIRPVNTGVVTAGWRYPSGSLHAAIDYGIPIGTPVYASAAGVVIKTANLNYSYGTYVVIQHANGMQTWYGHGSSLAVSQGETVSQGQLIMYSGNSGHSTGPHLHFEMRVAPYSYGSSSNPGNRVNPANYIN